ncbi:hypothetical protein C5S31_07900 [ANME-1 cluster archaeon GoMg2]|nr:hypothetical protein [ANME-1 cluster archaeon GoMg2]
MDKKEIYEELRRKTKNVRFEVLCRAAELFGFRFRGGKGSQRIYVKNGWYLQYKLDAMLINKVDICKRTFGMIWM